MHIPIEIIYLVSSVASVLAMVPQVKRLILTKQSDELSLGTWATWGCCQLVSLLYAISLNVRAYIIVNVAWISFYSLMVFLIVKYRKKRNIFREGISFIQRRKASGSFW